MSNHIDHYFVCDEKDPVIECYSDGRLPVVCVGDLRIYPTLDQLEHLHGAIGQTLHEHRPAPVAKACKPSGATVCPNRNCTGPVVLAEQSKRQPSATRSAMR